MLNGYALELQALKTELQLALARLGEVDAASPIAAGAPSVPLSAASTRTLPTAHSTPEWSSAGVGVTGSRASVHTYAARSASRDPQLLLQELRAAAQRRRELEAELASEMRRDRERAPWQSRAIAALRRQRAEIARELEEARRRDLDSATQMSPAPPTPLPRARPNSQPATAAAAAADKRFSIEGVVMLEPIPQSGGVAAAPAVATAARHHATAAPAASARHRSAALEREAFRSHHHHNETLSDVFSLQLKFAETMLKLEKSVQIREQLLQRSTAPPRRGRHELATHRSRPRTAARSDHTGQQLSDTESHDDDDDGDDVSSDSDSFSSSALELRTPSTENSDKISNSSAAKHVRFGRREGDEYATPVIAKKLMFENSSDDDDRDVKDAGKDDGADGSESPLSFLGGSSVTSAELNDVSLVKAFEAFRRELGMLKAASPQLFSSTAAPSGISAAISAARALFADDKASGGDPRRTVVLKPAKPIAVGRATTVGAANAPREPNSVVIANATVSAHTTVTVKDSVKRDPIEREKQQRVGGEKGRATLQERRRQLCLDIQSESAQLVLTFGSRNAHETERIKQTLIELRTQLRTIDEQLAQ
ncbi:hypothetical protein PybrP1_009842 [[Pythium] brassicae (nom. inval.)]|nr:hypothetical protein PybrP1_009842 [[Pythium] brassicae (nom. inval.)]